MSDRRLLRVLPIERWPTRDEASQMQWFSPIQVGPLELADRTWVPAMVPWRATEEGFVTEQVLGWYRRFAEGQPGAIVVEATGIRDVPSGPLLRIGEDRFLPGLQRLVQAVREASSGRTKLFIQLIDFLTVRRRPSPEKFFGQYLKIDRELRIRLASRLGEPELANADDDTIRHRLLGLNDGQHEAVLCSRDLESLRFGYRERVTDTHLTHILDLPQTLPTLFADASARARDAGFDGVELHYAHAYTMASFLSARNERNDGYGGALENRLRLPLEVYDAVRNRVGKDWVVGVRFLGDEVIEQGNRIDDAIRIGTQLARAGFDFLSISKGGKFEDAKQPKIGLAVYPYTGPSGHECMPTVKIDSRGPFGRNVPLAAQIRAAVRAARCTTPVVTSGGICSPWQAEAILQQEGADIVASARQTLCDPDWFLKMRRGHGSEVRRCFFTNYCEALDQRHVEVSCQRWDRDVRPEDPAGSRSRDGKRRLLAPRWQPS